MSAWGVGTFEDDIACDWLEDLHESDPLAFLQHCLDLTGHEYLEYLACIGVVCSAELVHGLHASPRAGLPSSFNTWCREHRDMNVTEMLPDAIAGLRRVLGPESEMRERWDDNEELSEPWHQNARGLLQLLLADQKESQTRLVDGLNRKDADDSGGKG